MLIDIIAGARPNFMKIAPIIRALQRRAAEGADLCYRLVHTGQHYDARLSQAFFDQLGIPEPDVNLEVGSGTQAEQTAGVMVGYEAVCGEALPAICLVVGDVNSTMACAITARKLGVPVAHVEAGIRSGDWSMPEEINRVVTDSITNWFYTTSEHANENLRRAGVDESRIRMVGNTMIDTLLANQDRFEPPDFWEAEALDERSYFVLTLHRPANVDLPDRLQLLLDRVALSARELPVVFPAHPRTRRALQTLAVPDNLRVVEPQPYLQFNYMVRSAKAVITDSGGITEETTVMGVPCITLRDSTERPETIQEGTNVLVGSDPEALSSAMSQIFLGRWKEGRIPPMWDGRAGERIVADMEQLHQGAGLG